MNNYKMTVQYDGTRYSGWQRQGNTAQTIQYKLEQALGRLLEEPIEVSGSGRTDAGVHALGQVANFKTEKTVDCGEFLARLNQLLPEDIAVTSLSAASPRFHARLGAKEKTYRYTINLSPVQDVFRRRYEYQLPEPLDLNKMEQAAELLTGTHDFRGFSTGHTKKSTVRYLRSIDFSREGDKLHITFTGNGFLYNMVRILTGTLIEVGQGKRSPDSVIPVFETKDRQLAGFTAPPQGLCLMQVTY
jgi:tRNA pseudouridine38-40 synthase